jgi:hypothetical protein
MLHRFVKDERPVASPLASTSNRQVSTSILILMNNDYVGSANATFVILARNSEMEKLVKSLKEIEDRFNHRYHYPFVFLNDEPFTDEFKKYVGDPFTMLISSCFSL